MRRIIGHMQAIAIALALFIALGAGFVLGLPAIASLRADALTNLTGPELSVFSSSFAFAIPIFTVFLGFLGIAAVGALAARLFKGM